MNAVETSRASGFPGNMRLIAVTSGNNYHFVKDLELYDQVLLYDDYRFIQKLPGSRAVYLDFSGNRETAVKIRARYDNNNSNRSNSSPSNTRISTRGSSSGAANKNLSSSRAMNFFGESANYDYPVVRGESFDQQLYQGRTATVGGHPAATASGVRSISIGGSHRLGSSNNNFLGGGVGVYSTGASTGSGLIDSRELYDQFFFAPAWIQERASSSDALDQTVSIYERLERSFARILNDSKTWLQPVEHCGIDEVVNAYRDSLEGLKQNPEVGIVMRMNYGLTSSPLSSPRNRRTAPVDRAKPLRAKQDRKLPISPTSTTSAQQQQQRRQLLKTSEDESTSNNSWEERQRQQSLEDRLDREQEEKATALAKEQRGCCSIICAKCCPCCRSGCSGRSTSTSSGVQSSGDETVTRDDHHFASNDRVREEDHDPLSYRTRRDHINTNHLDDDGIDNYKRGGGVKKTRHVDYKQTDESSWSCGKACFNVATCYKCLCCRLIPQILCFCVFPASPRRRK
ncbi:unnamed protein product [Amoebophrya sp. A25]|nr:unnamed protein product [Amoebophrya sp. A25]|eukprot:GSA25T00004556001.1